MQQQPHFEKRALTCLDWKTVFVFGPTSYVAANFTIRETKSIDFDRKCTPTTAHMT